MAQTLLSSMDVQGLGYAAATLVLVLGACDAQVGAPLTDEAEGPAPVDAGAEQPGPDANDEPDSEREPTSVSLSQNASTEVLPMNSVACIYNETDAHLENSYYRVFDLDAMGIDGPIDVSSVTFGVERAVAPGGSQQVVVKAHTLSGNLALANLTELASVEVSVTDQSGSLVAAPINASAPAGSVLVIEIWMPDDPEAVLFIGSNQSGQTQPAYLRAAATGCDIVEPTSLTDLGFPNVHIIMAADGTEL